MSFANIAFAAQAQRLYRDVEGTRPDNTKLAYDPKIQEYFQFCDDVFSEEEYPCTITEPKLFIFLYYHSYRGHKEQQKKRGHNGEILEQPKRFDRADYDKVIDANRSSLLAEGNTHGPAPPISEVEARRSNDVAKKSSLE